MRGSGENGATQLPSVFSWISNCTPVLRLQLSSTPCFSTLHDQAPGCTSLPTFVSDVAVFPGLFRRTAALTRSNPLRESLTEQWPNEQWPNVSCTQERLLDPAVAGALRLQPGASPPPKKIARQCSISISGIMENHNTHLAPSFTLNDLAPAPVNVAAFRGLLGPGGFNRLYQMSFQQWNHFSLCGPRTSWTPLCSWGFTFSTRAPPGIELQSCRLCTPLVYSLNGI
ncbi:Hypothetical predicted protein [Lynx pardinus]|uniref:Uncharacterized protein n=1 Tax=Lynx pardinus TaxID=191816 RepID=A0A485MSY3_LYNPA|nr:Hypothetical predicted protein [Lynx pardinus]